MILKSFIIMGLDILIFIKLSEVMYFSPRTSPRRKPYLSLEKESSFFLFLK